MATTDLLNVHLGQWIPVMLLDPPALLLLWPSVVPVPFHSVSVTGIENEEGVRKAVNILASRRDAASFWLRPDQGGEWPVFVSEFDQTMVFSTRTSIKGKQKVDEPAPVELLCHTVAGRKLARSERE